MAGLTKEQILYVNTFFNNYCKKIDKNTLNGEIFKLCRNFFDELEKNNIKYDEVYKCYNMMKEFRDKRK